MTVGKISALCWTLFVVMSVAFLPVIAGVDAISWLPPGSRIPIGVGLVLVLWWGPFCYAMYLSMAVVRNGDRRLLKRGVRGRALVLSVKRTNEVIQSGEFAWEAPRVYKYRLRVTLPDREPYETDTRICATGIREGVQVEVAASRHNHKRVTIDVGQGRVTKGSAGSAAFELKAQRYGDSPTTDALRSAARTGGSAQRSGFSSSGAPRFNSGGSFPSPGAAAFAAPHLGGGENDRLAALERLGRLREQGVLDDAEFAAEKARILGTPSDRRP